MALGGLRRRREHLGWTQDFSNLSCATEVPHEIFEHTLEPLCTRVGEWPSQPVLDVQLVFLAADPSSPLTDRPRALQIGGPLAALPEPTQQHGEVEKFSCGSTQRPANQLQILADSSPVSRFGLPREQPADAVRRSRGPWARRR